jgi:hypothetical protein
MTSAQFDSGVEVDPQEAGSRSAPSVPAVLAPAEDQAAVLSALLIRDRESWVVASGSLLTVDRSLAFTSWKRWGELQPAVSSHMASEGFDPGPNFVAEPFHGLRAARRVILANEWRQTLDALATKTFETAVLQCQLRASTWTSMVLLGIDVSSDAHSVVAGARRPVLGVVAKLDPRVPPASEAMWEIACPPYLSPGPDLGRMSPHRHLLHWPRALLGIDWLGDGEHLPPFKFVVGALQHEAWITSIEPDHDAEELKIHIAWDETVIDPLSCSLLLRNEQDGLPVFTRQIRISDYPSRAEKESSGVPEARSRAWSERLLTVGVPRGPRRTAWGVQLLSPDGRPLDERPVVPRVEQINFSMYVDGTQTPASTFTVGDSKPVPTAVERDLATELASQVETEARVVAAKRRISTAGELEHYLRWRFSARQGELLILDPYLFGGLADRPRVFSLLDALDRPIRALTRSIDPDAQSRLATLPHIQVKLLPRGSRTLHDRVWLVGDTALLVGGSINVFLPASAANPSPTTTVADLPHGDAVQWRAEFEKWW